MRGDICKTHIQQRTFTNNEENIILKQPNFLKRSFKKYAVSFLDLQI
jgi:hypothetical protein